MTRPLIAITGKDGQLGQELQLLAPALEGFDMLFLSSAQLDITDDEALEAFFNTHAPRYLVNCAAYTAVDKAEAEQDQAYRANAAAVGAIAAKCHAHNCILLTISTDYVFNGQGAMPYKPGDATDPVNYYGYTKRLGEKLTLENNPRTIIIRTSWLYSPFGKNFVKTMIRLMAEKKELGVVNDQVGCPTYAKDLAEALLQLIVSVEKGNDHFGIYHFCNAGAITWFDFATEIKKETGAACVVKPLNTAEYPTAAHRPAYSVLDCTDLANDFGIRQVNWRESLAACLKRV